MEPLMSLKSKSLALFGGALLSAGLATTAGGQSLIVAEGGYLPDPNTGEPMEFASAAAVAAGSYAPGLGFSFDVQDDALVPDNLNLSATTLDGSLTTSTTLTDSLVRYETDFDPALLNQFSTEGYASGIVQIFFQVSQDATLELTWDFTGTDFFGNPTLAVQFEGSGSVIPDAEGDSLITVSPTNPSGIAEVDLVSGTDYLLTLFGGSPLLGTSDVAFLQAELLPVPEPASLGLLAAAGLGLTRRRTA
jgi:hypothetical protein